MSSAQAKYQIKNVRCKHHEAHKPLAEQAIITPSAWDLWADNRIHADQRSSRRQTGKIELMQVSADTIESLFENSDEASVDIIATCEGEEFCWQGVELQATPDTFLAVHLGRQGIPVKLIYTFTSD